MNKKTARELLMDYLYEEISAADKKKLESYLDDHPELQQELDELGETRALLQKMPEAQPDEKLTIVETGSTKTWVENARALMPASGWGKAVLALAVCLILLLVAGSVADLNIESTEAGISITFGERPPTQNSGLTQAQTDALIRKIERENTAVMTEYADMLNRHNQQQLQQVVEYFERQRLNDLQLIDQALNQYQEQTDNQLQQTHQVLGEVLQTIASNDQQ